MILRSEVVERLAGSVTAPRVRSDLIAWFMDEDYGTTDKQLIAAHVWSDDELPWGLRRSGGWC